MPFSYTHDSANERIQVRISGDPTDAEMLAGAARILSDPELPKNLRILSNHRDLDLVVSPLFVKRMLDLVGQFPSQLKGSKIALVAATPASYGMQRLFSLRAESIPIQVEVFSNVEEAGRWLGSDTGGNTDLLQV